MMIRWCAFLCAIFAGLVLLQGCSNTAATDGDSRTSTKPGVEEGADESLEGFFVVPGIDFSRYKKLIVADLNLEQIAISGNSQKLLLTDDDKRFYRELYTAAVVDHLVADGAYTTALDAGQDVLFLAAAIIRVAAPDADAKTTSSPAMDAYLQSTSRITITLELYDSQNRQLLATLTDTWDLGRSWDDNNHQVQVMQMRRAFDYWLAYLRKELDILSVR